MNDTPHTTDPAWQALEARTDVQVIHDAPLARYSVVGVGGPADRLVIVRSREALIRAVNLARRTGEPWRLFGGASNVLFPDQGVRGTVILNRARGMTFDATTYRLHVEAGTPLNLAAREAIRRGWAGLTWAVGIPGSVGGAVVNNAGAFGGEIAHILASADLLMPDGRVERVPPAWFDFRYRDSRLKGQRTGAIVLAATFRLTPAETETLLAEAETYTQRRRRTQPSARSLGSVFKNPPGDYAGRLIEAVGLKGHRVGGFTVSPKHANFFVNVDGGSAADMLALIQLAQQKVAQQFNVHLELEVEVIPWND